MPLAATRSERLASDKVSPKHGRPARPWPPPTAGTVWRVKAGGVPVMDSWRSIIVRSLLPVPAAVGQLPGNHLGWSEHRGKRACDRRSVFGDASRLTCMQRRQQRHPTKEGGGLADGRSVDSVAIDRHLEQRAHLRCVAGRGSPPQR